MTKPDTLLSVRNLSIDFHLRTHVLHAVRNVSFDLKRGQTMALVGESGSGKSVTARALMRIIDKPGRMIGGQILLDGPNGPVDVARFKEGSREVLAIRGGRIGLIFQEPMSSLSPVHTIGSQIVEAVRLHRRVSKSEARARCVELLHRLAIPRRWKITFLAARQPNLRRSFRRQPCDASARVGEAIREGGGREGFAAMGLERRDV